MSISLVAIALTKTVKAWVPEFPERDETIGNKAAKATTFWISPEKNAMMVAENKLVIRLVASQETRDLAVTKDEA